MTSRAPLDLENVREELSAILGRERDFDETEYRQRLARVRQLLTERQLDAIVVTSPENIYYLCGLNHQGYFAFTMLLVAVDSPLKLVAREMDAGTIAAQSPWVEHMAFGDSDEAVAAAVRCVRDAGLSKGRIGIEKQSMFCPPIVVEALKEHLTGASWTDESRLLARLRLIKSPAELRYVRAAGRISDHAMQAAVAATGAGAFESEIAADALRAMTLAGGEYPGFVPFVRPAAALGLAHTSWANRQLHDREALFLELSGCVARYHAPMSRTVPIGSGVPAPAAIEAALSALTAVEQTLCPGMAVGQVYSVWQDTIRDHLGSIPLHEHCGYVIGIGFPPSWVGGSEVTGIRADGEWVLESGMVFHLLSLVSHESVGRFAVSETAIVRADGAELVSRLERDFWGADR